PFMPARGITPTCGCTSTWIRLGLSILPDPKTLARAPENRRRPVHIPSPEIPPSGLSETEYSEAEKEVGSVA
ncbi:MAG TPA: hypothetical protein VGE83_02290, partial [Terracidiphilus sp.]